MRNYPNGSTWQTKYEYVDNTEITVEQVLYNDGTGEKWSDQDLIIYRDHAAGTISCMRRSHADDYLEKVEPKWEVGVTYEPPGSSSHRNNILVKFVFDDGSAAFETVGYQRGKGVKPPEFRKHWAVKKD